MRKRKNDYISMYIAINGFSKCLRVSSLTGRQNNLQIAVLYSSYFYMQFAFWVSCLLELMQTLEICGHGETHRHSLLFVEMQHAGRVPLPPVFEAVLVRYLAQLVLVLQQVPIPDRGSSAADSELVKLGSEDYAWFCRGGLIVKLYDALHQFHVLLGQVLPSQRVEVVLKQSVARREWRRSDGE